MPRRPPRSGAGTSHRGLTAAAPWGGGGRTAFYKVQNKDLFFKQVTLVYFIHYTFFLQKKIKLYNCINIKFFHHENG